MTLDRVRSGTLPSWISWPALALAALLFSIETYSLAGYIGSDFVIFHDAARQFLSDPGQLYDLESAKTLQGFLYPPPALLPLLPLGGLSQHWAFWVFSGLGFILLTSALGWWIHMAGTHVSLTDRAALLGLALVTGPVFSLRAGQIDGFVLALMILAIALARAGVLRWAGVLLAAGCWIKIYPVLLLAYAATLPGRWRFFSGFLVAALAIPATAMLIVPIEHYRVYFTALLPQMSEGTIINIYNQSLPAIAGRLMTSPELALSSFDVVAIAAPWRVGLLALAALCITAFVTRVRCHARSDLFIAGWCLAVIPLLSPLGWGHSYVYVLPLMLLLAVRLIEEHRWFGLVILGCAWAGLVPTAHFRLRIAEQWPELMWHAVYARYAVMTIIIMMLAWTVTRQEALSSGLQAVLRRP